MLGKCEGHWRGTCFPRQRVSAPNGLPGRSGGGGIIGGVLWTFWAPHGKINPRAADWYAPDCDRNPTGEAPSGEAENLPAEAAGKADSLPAGQPR